MKHGAPIAFALAVALLFSTPLSARFGTPPPSFSADVRSVDDIDHRTLPAPDVYILMAEDAKNHGRRVPYRVALPLVLDLSMNEAGTWETLADGGRLWRLRLSAPDALFLSIKFDDFQLPRGCELYFHSVHKVYHDGPYTARDNNEARRFGSGLIPGGSAVIEVRTPFGSKAPAFTIESVSYGYRDVLRMGAFADRDPKNPYDPDQPVFRAGRPPGNFDCQRDINCPEGAPYQNEKRAVAEGYDGTYICSGALVNNVRQDCLNYYITANHCGFDADPASMAYYWNYENSGCGTADAPLEYSTGSWNRYPGNSADDVTLMELYDNLDTYDVYYLGWTRDTSPSTESAMISFPDDKPKQITIDTDTLLDCAVDSCPGGWGSQYWRLTSWEVGVDEGGSSGGALMNQDHLVVGTLTGGVGTDCDDFEWDEFGKFYDAMNKGMDAYLDPDSTGALSVGPKDNTACDCPMIVDVTPDAGGPVCLGTDITFSAATQDGVPPYSYQWQKNDGGWADIPGATSSTYAANEPPGTWEFNCKVSDSSGSCFDVDDETAAAGTWQICGPYIEYDSDTGLAAVDEDGDAIPEAGERWSLAVTVVNSGTAAADTALGSLAGEGLDVCNNPGLFLRTGDGATTLNPAETGVFAFEFVILDPDWYAAYLCGDAIGFDLVTKSSDAGAETYPDDTDFLIQQVGSPPADESATAPDQTTVRNETRDAAFTPAFTVPATSGAAVSYSLGGNTDLVNCVEVLLVAPDASTTTLKAAGAADANPYDVSAFYNAEGPGAYTLRITELSGCSQTQRRADVTDIAMDVPAAGGGSGCTTWTAVCTIPCPEPTGLNNNTAVDLDGACFDHGVEIAWDQDPGDWQDGGSGTRTYDVLRDGSPIGGPFPYGTTSHVDTTGVNGTAYTYAVQYNNGCGAGASTAGVTAADDFDQPGSPVLLSVTDTDAACSLEILFTPGAGAAQHDLWVDGALVQENIPDPYYYSPAEAESHDFVVRAVNGTCFADSDTLSGSDPDCVPCCVQEVTPLLWTDAVTVEWTPVGGYSNYTLYRGGLTDLPAVLDDTLDSCVKYDGPLTTAAENDDPTAIAGRLYWYIVTGGDGFNEGPAGDATAGERVIDDTGACP